MSGTVKIYKGISGSVRNLRDCQAMSGTVRICQGLLGYVKDC